jgi:long-chain fatty acid transport protein
MEMADGLYANVSGQYLFKDYNNEINGNDFDQDEPSIVPGIFSIFKKDCHAIFFGVSNVLGGGEVDFKDGNATTNLLGYSIATGANARLLPALTSPPLSDVIAGQDPRSYLYSNIENQELWAEQETPGYTLGGAYQIPVLNDIFSVALAARYVDTTRKMKGSVTIGAAQELNLPNMAVNPDIIGDVRFEEEADGWGALVGFNAAPTDQLNIGLRYESEVQLDFDQDVKEDTLGILPALGITDGGERNRNLPAILAAGVSYLFTPKLRVETDVTYYLNEQANFKDIAGTPRKESAVDDGYEFGLMCEYMFTETIKGSLGYLYTYTGVDAENMTPELPELDSHAVGTGFEWAPKPALKFNFGVGNVFYDDASFTSPATGAKITYEKEIIFLAFGVQYKFL